MGLPEDSAKAICKRGRRAPTPGEVHTAQQEQEERSEGNDRERWGSEKGTASAAADQQEAGSSRILG